MGAGMAQTNATRTLAEALSAAEARAREARARENSNPLVDRLATALTVPAFDSGDYDDDDDLDLPMLVQGDRFGAIVPLELPHREPPQRGREGRAALVGFGLGLVMLIPIGIGMNSLLPERGSTPVESPTMALVQGSVTTTATLEDVGIRTNRTATQTIVPTAAPLSEPVAAPVLESMPRPAVASVESKAAVAPVEPTAAVAPIEPKTAVAPVEPKTAVAPVEFKTAGVPVEPKAIEPPKPDRLSEAQALIASGDIDAARALLKPLTADNNPTALLMLGETFDPNMLAAWSTRGTTADADRARTLYKRALAQGEIKARQRLEALE
jgi:hypothetical protein